MMPPLCLCFQVEPNAKASGRRFQPPRRKDRVSKVRSEGPSGTAPPGPAAPPAPPAPSAPVPPTPYTNSNVPRPAAVTGDSASANPSSSAVTSTPSAEMAWLLRVSEKFDEDAEQAVDLIEIQETCVEVGDPYDCHSFWPGALLPGPTWFGAI